MTDTGQTASPLESYAAALCQQHTSTGWALRSSGGQYQYRHHGGVITADGYVPAHRDLGRGPFEGYLLAAPTRDAAGLGQAWRTGTRALLDVAPPHILVPLIGQAFASILVPSPHPVVVVDRDDSVNSRLIAQVMHHFGVHWEWPIAAVSGPNAGTRGGLLASLRSRQDTLVWLDDVASAADGPRRGPESIIRALHMQAGAEVGNGPAHPRGLRCSVVLSTCDVPHRDTSGQTMLVVPVEAGEIDPGGLARADSAASRAARTLVMASFISWLAGDLTTHRRNYRQVLGHLLAGAALVDPGGPIQHAWMGWVACADFLVDVGALTSADRARTLSLARGALVEAQRVDRATQADH